MLGLPYSRPGRILGVVGEIPDPYLELPGSEEIPQDPAIKANQALIRVRACALNHLDLFVRAGIPGTKFSMLHIPGSGIAGEVVEAGELCERVNAGMRVMLASGMSCRQCGQCLSGNNNPCPRLYAVRRWHDNGLVVRRAG